MRPLSEKIAGVTESATIAISNKAKTMQREGIDVISLSIGEPDFATPQHITDACIDALRRGETHYAPSNGIPELTAAISDKIIRENGFSCTPQQVIVACGAKDAIYEACEAVLNPGDETILLTPAWVSYEPCVHIAGGKVVKHAINPKTFQLDDSILERVNAKTKMIVVNSPSNPTGAVFNAKSMKLVADLCSDHDLYAMSDEIYEKMIYGKEHVSLAAIGDMAQRTITINGFSKAYAMTGWRLGYAVAPIEIIREMSKVQQHSISQATTFAMWGGVAALNGDQTCVEEMRKEFDRAAEVCHLRTEPDGLRDRTCGRGVLCLREGFRGRYGSRFPLAREGACSGNTGQCVLCTGMDPAVVRDLDGEAEGSDGPD